MFGCKFFYFSGTILHGVNPIRCEWYGRTCGTGLTSKIVDLEDGVSITEKVEEAEDGGLAVSSPSAVNVVSDDVTTKLTLIEVF